MVRVSRWVIRITLLRAEDALGDSAVVCGVWCYYDHNSFLCSG